MSMRDTCHDKMDFPESHEDLSSIEVWSNEPDRDGGFYDKARVCLNVDPANRDEPEIFALLTVSEARQLAAMLTRAAERVEAMKT